VNYIIFLLEIYTYIYIYIYTVIMSSAVSEEPLSGGAKRKIRLGNEHMNLQPSLPISGER
jgi:hypothetical protein